MSEIEAKSYRYLRTAMVALLLGLGAAVGYQTVHGKSLLSSVSAYYYTPAQAIFVGALVALGACMIALRGTNRVEDVFLNLGGIFVTVVALVPTSRNEDYRATIRACEQSDGSLLTGKASAGMDCPTVRALAAATKENVENNIVAALFVGALALIAAVLFFVLRDSRTPEATFPVWCFGAVLVVYLSGAAAFWMSRDWFIGHAHDFAAISLFGCILVVAVANAHRHDTQRAQTLHAAPTALIRSKNIYAWFARLMLIAAAILITLRLLNWISMFALEIVVAAFFALFWMVQTVEQWHDVSNPPNWPESDAFRKPVATLLTHPSAHTQRCSVEASPSRSDF